MSRCVLLCAAPDFVLPPLRPDDYLIACDGGYEHAVRHGLTVALFVGDQDSFRGMLPESLPRLLAPKEKDDTDAYMAARHALSLGYLDFLILGGLGGRLDHTLGNLQLAAFIARSGGFCALPGARETIYAISNGRLTLRVARGLTISVFAQSDEARGVTLRGMKYPLCAATIRNTYPIGVSNIAIEPEVCVEVTAGTLLIALEREPVYGGEKTEDERDASFVRGENRV